MQSEPDATSPVELPGPPPAGVAPSAARVAARAKAARFREATAAWWAALLKQAPLQVCEGGERGSARAWSTSLACPPTPDPLFEHGVGRRGRPCRALHRLARPGASPPLHRGLTAAVSPHLSPPRRHRSQLSSAPMRPLRHAGSFCAMHLGCALAQRGLDVHKALADTKVRVLTPLLLDSPPVAASLVRPAPCSARGTRTPTCSLSCASVSLPPSRSPRRAAVGAAVTLPLTPATCAPRSSRRRRSSRRSADAL